MSTQAAVPASVRRRLWVVGGLTLVVPLALVAGFGHRGQHLVRNLLVPGAGLYDEHLLVGLLLTALAVAAIVAWLRWGADWLVGAVLALSLVLTVALTETSHPTTAAAPQVAAHEFPLVILVIAMLGTVRSTLRRLPGADRIAGRRARVEGGWAGLDPVARCRAATLVALAGTATAGERAQVVAAIQAPDVAARARRVGLVARGRRGGDPFRADHAAARTALAAWDLLDPDERRRLGDDAARSWTGVPASEPGWVRLLDGTLAALVLGDRDPELAAAWRALLCGPLALHRGHRPAWIWTPLGIAAGRGEDWEHATAAALAHRAGWIGADDWPALRARCLGAAARGTAAVADERMIAAGRLWTSLVEDPSADRILARPTIARDPLAVAVAGLASGPRPAVLPEGIPA